MAAPPLKTRKWSADVTENSNALDRERNIFKSDSPIEIARSLKEFGGAEPAAQIDAVPFSHVDADVLYQ